jgi:hypothetical protein
LLLLLLLSGRAWSALKVVSSSTDSSGSISSCYGPDKCTQCSSKGWQQCSRLPLTAAAAAVTAAPQAPSADHNRSQLRRARQAVVCIASSSLVPVVAASGTELQSCSAQGQLLHIPIGHGAAGAAWQTGSRSCNED